MHRGQGVEGDQVPPTLHQAQPMPGHIELHVSLSFPPPKLKSIFSILPSIFTEGLSLLFSQANLYFLLRLCFFYVLLVFLFY